MNKAPGSRLDWRGIFVGQSMFPKMVCSNNGPRILINVALSENESDSIEFADVIK